MAGPQRVAQSNSQPSGLTASNAQEVNPFADLVEEDAPIEINVGGQEGSQFTGQVSGLQQDISQQGAEQVQADANMFSDLGDEEALPVEEELTPDRFPQEPGEEDPQAQKLNEMFRSLEVAKEDIANKSARFRLSFAGTDDSKLAEAKKIFKSKKVEMIDGELFVGGKVLDKDDEDIISEALDWSREATETAIDVGVTAAATPFVGPLAAGALGATTALNLTDQIAENLLGIARDPNRSRTLENSLAVGMGASFNLFGATLARKAAAKAISKKAAVETLETAGKKMDAATEAVQEVMTSGFVKEGDEIKFLAGQVIGKKGDIMPSLGVLEKNLSTEPGFKNFVIRQGEAISNAYDGMAKQLGAKVGATVDAGKRIATRALDLTRIEGKAIGTYRDAAIKSSKGVAQPVNRAVETIQKELQELGIDHIGKLRTLDVDDILAQNISMSRDQAERYLIMLKTVGKTIIDNPQGISLKKMDTIYTGLRRQIDNLANKTSGADKTDLPLMEKLIEIKNSLRDDWTDAIGNELGPGVKEAYQENLAAYSKKRIHVTNLNRVLKQENISREAFIKDVFNKGKKGLSHMRDLRALVQTEDPKLWKEFVGDYFNQLKSANTKDGVVNWSAAKKQFDDLGSQFHDEIFNGAGVTKRQANAMFEVGNLFTQAKFNFSSEAAEATGFKNFVKAKAKAAVLVVSNIFMQTRVDAAAQLMKSMGGKQNTLAKYLKAGGLEDLVQHMPELKAAMTRTKLEAVVEAALSSAGAATKIATGTGQDPASRLVRTGIRSQSQNIGNQLLTGTGLEEE